MTSLAGPAFKYVDEFLEVVLKLLNETQPFELQLVFTTGSNEWNEP
jgi:hypothetical protein